MTDGREGTHRHLHLKGIQEDGTRYTVRWGRWELRVRWEIVRGHGAMGRYEELCAGDSCCHCSSGTVFNHEFWSSVRCRTTTAIVRTLPRRLP